MQLGWLASKIPTSATLPPLWGLQICNDAHGSASKLGSSSLHKDFMDRAISPTHPSLFSFLTSCLA